MQVISRCLQLLFSRTTKDHSKFQQNLRFARSKLLTKITFYIFFSQKEMRSTTRQTIHIRSKKPLYHALFFVVFPNPVKVWSPHTIKYSMGGGEWVWEVITISMFHLDPLCTLSGLVNDNKKSDIQTMEHFQFVQQNSLD